MSLRERIINYLRQWHEIEPQKFINGGEIEKLAQEIGFKASNASRRLRELENEGYIERRINNGSVEYRIALYEDLIRKYPLLFEKQTNTQQSLL